VARPVTRAHRSARVASRGGDPDEALPVPVEAFPCGHPGPCTEHLRSEPIPALAIPTCPLRSTVARSSSRREREHHRQQRNVGGSHADAPPFDASWSGLTVRDTQLSAPARKLFAFPALRSLFAAGTSPARESPETSRMLVGQRQGGYTAR